MSTSLVIPTKNNIDTIDKCLSSVMPYYEAGYINEIVVVDGNSTDGTLDVVKKYPVKLLFDEGKKNPGLAYDIGWRQTKGDLVFFLDSDVYLEEGFFPKAHDLVSAEGVGWISCRQKAVASNSITKTQGEDWDWGSNILSKPSSWFQKLYNIALAGKPEPTCGGPCIIVRKVCLEEIDGHHGINEEVIKWCSDIAYSQRIANRGWVTKWWTEAPIYHHPRATFKGYYKQMYAYGKSIAFMHLEQEFKSQYSWYNRIFGILARLASPIIGVYLAVRYRNPEHLVLYPVPRYAVVAGYIAGWFQARKLTSTAKP